MNLKHRSFQTFGVFFAFFETEIFFKSAIVCVKEIVGSRPTMTGKI